MTFTMYHKISGVTNVPVYSRLKHDYIKFILLAIIGLLRKLASKNVVPFHRYATISAHVPKRALQFASKTSVYRNGLYIRVCNSKYIVSASLCLVPFQR